MLNKIKVTEDCNNLLLFIHGFTGGEETWKNENDDFFYKLLLEENTIRDNFDVVSFEYFTTLTNIYAKSKNTSKSILGLFKKVSIKTEKNNSIEEISNILNSEIRFNLKQYDNIVVVAHSMGGLIAKSTILKNYQKDGYSKIKLFLSLAVPHSGAEIATIGKMISSNLQISDLSPLSKIISELNNGWVRASIKPNTKYFYGTHDTIVLKESAIGTDSILQDEIPCDENHVSISKPNSKDAISFQAVKNFLIEYLTNENNNLDLEIKELDNDCEFMDEHFVLKLILADVHKEIIYNAKENFLNAEYSRKFFSSPSEQNTLNELFKKIRSLYRDSYARYVTGELKTSDELVNEVHCKIMEEDNKLLKTFLPFMNGLHKKGMIHQLSNDLEKDIWWSSTKSKDELEKLRK
ncbi:MAG: ABC-three component system protein [Arcobacter sp.]|uniref:ABC-three component system protein n=1 Tax=Arcobacter sp. TaxID=1872629 RepID=UPI003C734066